jgi:hypothetical protein
MPPKPELHLIPAWKRNPEVDAYAGNVDEVGKRGRMSTFEFANKTYPIDRFEVSQLRISCRSAL